jgi:shikimate dehydrogenase
MTDQYAVMGNPIAHSKSPDIHRAFAEQTGQDINYVAMLVEHGDFVNAVKSFQASSGKGLNITVPFKIDAYQLATHHSVRAERAGAANTLLFNNDGSIDADNTDGIGLVRDLTENNAISLQGKHLLILGAGGAVQGVLYPLLEQGPASLLIANRSAEKALALQTAATIEGYKQVSACSFDDLAGKQFDGIINGTSASLQGEMPPLPGTILQPGGWAYDMMYAAKPTPFMAWAKANGAGKVMDGLGMLVEQAAESFRLWRGIQPESKPVIAQLRKKLNAV